MAMAKRTLRDLVYKHMRQGLAWSCVLSAPPPSLNNSYINIPGRGRVKSPTYANWLARTAREIQIQRPLHIAGRFGVSLDIGCGLSKADLDNMIKGALDALVKAHVVRDDRFMDYVCARRINRPDVLINVFSMEGRDETIDNALAGSGGATPHPARGVGPA